MLLGHKCHLRDSFAQLLSESQVMDGILKFEKIYR
jgi:hypothetical protein